MIGKSIFAEKKSTKIGHYGFTVEYAIKNFGVAPAFNTIVVLGPTIDDVNNYALVKSKVDDARKTAENIVHMTGNLLLPGGEKRDTYAFWRKPPGQQGRHSGLHRLPFCRQHCSLHRVELLDRLGRRRKGDISATMVPSRQLVIPQKPRSATKSELPPVRQEEALREAVSARSLRQPRSEGPCCYTCFHYAKREQSRSYTSLRQNVHACKESRGVSCSRRQAATGEPIEVYAISCDHTWKLTSGDSKKLRENSDFLC